MNVPREGRGESLKELTSSVCMLGVTMVTFSGDVRTKLASSAKR